MKKYFFAFIPVVLILVFVSCSSSSYKTTESGLTYKFHRSDNGTKPLIDEIIKVDMAYRFPEDSVIFCSIDYGQPIYLAILPSEYKGDIYEGFRMVSVNDSISFKLDANQFFTTTLKYDQLPDFFDEGDSLFVDIVLHEIFTKSEFEAYQEKEREAFMEEQEKLALAEKGILENYLRENAITAEAEESGLIIILEEQGRGPKPQAGQKVKVHYTGKLLDGTVFDSSIQREPIEFDLGKGQVIRGWEEGLSKINVGSKATFIIPSYLAYGDQERGRYIKPYSTLIFEVELIDAR